jgi:hypothetical protein
MMHGVLTCHSWRFDCQLEFDPAIGNKARFRRMEGAGACVMDVHVELYMYTCAERERHTRYAGWSAYTGCQ